MLVLNRRPGESIIIEPGVVVTVLSVVERRVWICVEAPGMPPLRISAVLGTATDARLELGPLAEVAFGDGGVGVTVGGPSHPAAAVGAALALNCRPGEGVTVAGGTRVEIASVAKGNPCVALRGPAIGDEVRVTLIRPAGNYVRLGVDAPDRRVFRRELWDAVRAREGGQDPAGATQHAPAALTNAMVETASGTVAG